MSFVRPQGVLGELCALAEERVAESRRQPLPPRTAPAHPFALRAALVASRGFPLVCEVKRASPSAGTLRAELDVAEQARTYARAGAAAISVLTEPSKFRGSLVDLARAREAVTVPILRKDFLVDPRMVDEAYAYGADAVLLIAAAIPHDVLLACAARADELGLDCLLELIYPRDLDVLALRRWPLVGINARDLETLAIDMRRFGELAPAARAEGRILVAESGLASAAALATVRAAGANAALLGEALVRSDAPAALISAWSAA